MRLLLLSFVFVSWAAYSNEWPTNDIQKKEAHTSNATKKAETNKQGTPENPFIVKRLDAEETPERRKQMSAERNEKAANERSLVIWTITLAVATIVLGLIAAGQLGMFFQQLKLMRRGTDDAKDLAIAAKASADAAKINADAVIASERAYIFVEIFLDAELSSEGVGLQNAIRIKIWNYGKTPAEILIIRAYGVVQADTPQSLIEVEGSDKELPPGFGIAKDCAYEITVSPYITEAEIEEIKRWEKKLFCVGLVIYEDIFKKRRETGFCWDVLSHRQGSKFVITRNSQLNKRT